MYAKYDDFGKFEGIINPLFGGYGVRWRKPHFVITVKNVIKSSLHYVINPQLVITCCILY